MSTNLHFSASVPRWEAAQSLLNECDRMFLAAIEGIQDNSIVKTLLQTREESGSLLLFYNDLLDDATTCGQLQELMPEGAAQIKKLREMLNNCLINREQTKFDLHSLRNKKKQLSANGFPKINLFTSSRSRAVAAELLDKDNDKINAINAAFAAIDDFAQVEGFFDLKKLSYEDLLVLADLVRAFQDQMESDDFSWRKVLNDDCRRALVVEKKKPKIIMKQACIDNLKCVTEAEEEDDDLSTSTLTKVLPSLMMLDIDIFFRMLIDKKVLSDFQVVRGKELEAAQLFIVKSMLVKIIQRNLVSEEAFLLVDIQAICSFHKANLDLLKSSKASRRMNQIVERIKKYILPNLTVTSGDNSAVILEAKNIVFEYVTNACETNFGMEPVTREEKKRDYNIWWKELSTAAYGSDLSPYLYAIVRGKKTLDATKHPSMQEVLTLFTEKFDRTTGKLNVDIPKHGKHVKKFEQARDMIEEFLQAKFNE